MSPDGLVLVLALTLSWTNPTTNAGPSPCSTGTIPLTDLSHVEVWDVTTDTLWLATLDAVGREGQREQYDLPDSVGTVMVVAVDGAGNRACPATLQVWRTLDGVRRTAPCLACPSATVPVLPVERAVWYDVAGRRLPERPRAPGVYWRRTATRTHRVVVLP